jgi:hypothetical protein
MIYLCSCGFGTDDREWFQGHLWEHPGHYERPGPRLLSGDRERSHGLRG